MRVCAGCLVIHAAVGTLLWQVLLTCELSELKDVVQMSFGDWELFRTLVTMLREKDEALTQAGNDSTSSAETLHDVTPSPPADVALPRNFLPMKQLKKSKSVEEAVQTPKPVYAQSPPRYMPPLDELRVSPPSAEHPITPPSADHPTTPPSADPTPLARGTPPSQPEDAEIARLNAPRDSVVLQVPGMTRKNSMVDDFIKQTHYLHALMSLPDEDVSEESHNDEQQSAPVCPV